MKNKTHLLFMMFNQLVPLNKYLFVRLEICISELSRIFSILFDPQPHTAKVYALLDILFSAVSLRRAKPHHNSRKKTGINCMNYFKSETNAVRDPYGLHLALSNAKL